MNEVNQDKLEWLHQSLDRRVRPEDVIQCISETQQGKLSTFLTSLFNRALPTSMKNWGYGSSSMSQDFKRPIGCRKQVGVAKNLFASSLNLTDSQSDDPISIEHYLLDIIKGLGTSLDKLDFKKDRLTKAQRKAAGIELSKRQYNKRFRLVARMRTKQGVLIRELRKRHLTLVSKSRFASTIQFNEFAKNKETAFFIAYYTARCHLRSEFTIAGQQKPYDEIADGLFNQCRKSSDTNWWAIAQVFPDQEVLSHLSDQQKGELMGKWFLALEEIATLLKEVWEASDFNRESMIVKRGNDSTTWNVFAGAWNKCREGWINLLYSMNMDEVVEKFCPGKVLRLIAADVAAWHRSAGQGLDPNTFVWNQLPFPWQVMRGEGLCSRSQVEEACNKNSLDPIKSGWVAPRPGRTVAQFRPTPELVHGVSIGHPGLASILRQMGVFSGKSVLTSV